METDTMQNKEEFLKLPLTWFYKQGPQSQKEKSLGQKIPSVAR